jgi:hypothetical protein
VAQKRNKITDRSKDLADSASDAIGGLLQKSPQLAEKAAEMAPRAAKTIAERAPELARAASSRTKSPTVRKAVGRAAEEAAKRAPQIADTVADRMPKLAQRAADRGGKMRSRPRPEAAEGGPEGGGEARPGGGS